MRDGDFDPPFEPGAMQGGMDPAMVSIAISLRRIADLMREQMEPNTALAASPAPAEEVAPPSLDQDLWAGFTRSERRVAALLAQGLQTPKIAQRLGSADGTIRVHIAALLRKAGVTTRTAFVARLYRLGEPS